MPHMAIYDMAGEKSSDIEVPDDLLGLPFNADLVHQAVLTVDRQRKRRCGKVKGRAEVAATSAKWYRQKGLGRARHGAQSAPLFVGGGVAHGPTGVHGSYKMPKRMRRKAVFTALSERVRGGAVTIVERLELEGISTKAFVEVLEDLELEGRILMLVGKEEAADEVLHKSSRNVPGLIVREAPHFNTRDVVWAEEILITRPALAQITGGGSESAE